MLRDKPSATLQINDFHTSLKLEDILHDAPTSPVDELLGYLGTPLTAVVASAGQNNELERVVSEIRRLASSPEFVNPKFNLYWPGDFTHPTKHPDFKPSQVYLTDPRGTPETGHRWTPEKRPKE